MGIPPSWHPQPPPLKPRRPLSMASPPTITPFTLLAISGFASLFLPADSPSHPTSLPVILYFHGGGFVSFSPAYALCRKLAGYIGAVVISVTYRFSPENRYPSQYDDGFDVLRLLDDEEKIRDFDFPTNADLTRCFIAGDSAGGNIAHHVALRACENGVQFKRVKIRGVIGIQPFFGGKERTESELETKNNGLSLDLDQIDFFWKAFLPNGADRDHPAVKRVRARVRLWFNGFGRVPANTGGNRWVGLVATLAKKVL